MARTDMPSGVITEYLYDALNRLDVLTHYRTDSDNEDLTDNSVIATYDYEVRVDGKRTQVVEGHDVDDDGTIEATEFNQIDWTYDDVGRLVSEVFDHYDDAYDQTLGFVYDLVGNRLSQTKDNGNDGTTDETTSYEYDANDRLTDEALVATNGLNSSSTEYGYDHTQQTGKTTSNPGSNRITTVANTYDLQGRLESVSTTIVQDMNVLRDDVVAYDYDASGIRVSKAVTENGSTTDTQYLFDHQNHTGYQQALREEVRVDGVLEKTIEYTFGHDELSQTVTTFHADGTIADKATHEFLHDGHASVRVLIDALGAIAELYVFTAYGEALGRWRTTPR